MGYTGLEIAVIGMSGRFPGAKSLDEFWNNLKNGVESITFFTREYLQEAGISSRLLEDSNYVRTNGSILESKDYFDASFFGYSPSEAEIMEPQIRIFHECVWEALEDAGYNPYIYDGAIGLYAGASSSFNWEAASFLSGKNDTLGAYEVSLLRDRENLCTKVSYKLNLKGPAVLVQSACSTSLAAIDQACRALLTGLCDLVLAGGICIDSAAKEGYIYQEGMLMSPDGHCRTFDAEAKGIVPGEGAGVVLLKLLENALEDGDHIHGVIKGTAINNDGSRKVGYTAPSIKGQVEVILAALRMAEVEPESITYIETHGTGTILGDPIEIKALIQAFNSRKKGFCGIGSLKTNIGHLDAAAGVASFIKTLLALKHRLIPPSLNFNSPNGKIDFINSPFYVNTALTPWITHNNTELLRAGVSSLGIGGTNVHIVLEESPTRERDIVPTASNPAQLILLSAKTESALNRASQRLVDYFRKNPGIPLEDAAFSLQVGRNAFKYRRALLSASKEEVVNKLLSQEPGAMARMYCLREENPPVVFVFPGAFPGKGLQPDNAKLRLYQGIPLFRQELDRCLQIFKGNTDDPGISRALHMAIEYALARYLIKLGVKPFAVIGYGIGQYAAACLCGIFSLEHALELALYKGHTRFEEKIRQIKLNKPKINFMSSVSNKWLTPAQAVNPAYWIAASKESVQSSAAETVCRLLANEEILIYVETGAGNRLKDFARQEDSKENQRFYVSLLEETAGDTTNDDYLLGKLGELWIYGEGIDWMVFHSGEKRQRVPLPTYPFAEQPYPVTRNLFQVYSQLACKKTVTLKNPDISAWFYLPSWSRGQSLSYHNSQMQPGACWLVFVDEGSIGLLVVKQLKKMKQEVIIVSIGTEFSRVGPGHYLVNPREKSHYEMVLRELSGMGKMPGTILHLWGLYPAPSEEPNSQLFDELQYKGFYSLLFLAKAIGQQKFNDDIRLAVVANQTADITGNDPIRPEKSVVVGLTKVISQEFPFIICRAVDIVLPRPGEPQEKKVAEQMIRDLSSGSFEPVTAYRGDYRWIQTFSPLPLKEVGDNMPKLRKKGIYLIIGGLGDIGGVLAEYLAQQVQARLVLMGRSPIPAGQQGDDSVNRKMLKIKKIEELGGQVLVVSADVAKPEQLEQAVTHSEAYFGGSINGVFHAAGDTGASNRCTIDKVDEANCRAQFQARVYGLMALDRVMRTREPDFCLVVSSLVSVLAGPGFAAYAASCIFMDTFVQYRSKRDHIHWISVNTAEWLFREIPSFVESRIGTDVKELFMTIEEGVETFKRILCHCPENRIVVSTGDLQSRINKWIKLDSIRRYKSAGVGNKTALNPRPDLPYPYAAPVNYIQQTLVNIWQDLFGFQPLGIHDEFFQLGGDSLKAITVISQIHKKLDVAVPLVDFYTNPTPEKLARHINDAAQNRYTPLEPVEKKEYYPLSPAQHRLYVLHQVDPNNLSYNIPTMMVMEGDIDIEKLETVFKQLIRKHDSFRTAFTMVNEIPVQRIYDDVDFEITRYDLSSSQSELPHQEKKLAADFVTTFDLDKAPLLKLGVNKRKHDQFLLMIDIHHIITDVNSLDILVREYTALCNSQEMPLARLQYKDFAHWQHNKMQSGELARQEDFWLNMFAGEPPVLNLPLDYARPEIKSFEGANISFFISPQDTLGLKKLTLAENASLFITCLAVLNVFLSKLSGQDDIIVGTSPTGRHHADLESIIGFFVNTLALRNYPQGHKTFREFLREVRKSTLLALDNQDFQFDDLCEKIIKNRDVSRNPLFDVMFTLQNKKISEVEVAGVKSKDYNHGITTAKFDLNLNGYEVANHLAFSLEYCTKLFTEKSIRVFISHFQKIISLVMKNPDAKISDMALTSMEKRNEILSQGYDELENE
jgi:acyl transferase domain-containing protein/acyl carrier protein